MFTTYQIDSAKKLNGDIVDAIKKLYNNKPITISVEETLDTTAYLLATKANRNLLKKSLKQAMDKNFVELN